MQVIVCRVVHFTLYRVFGFIKMPLKTLNVNYCNCHRLSNLDRFPTNFIWIPISNVLHNDRRRKAFSQILNNLSCTSGNVRRLDRSLCPRYGHTKYWGYIGRSWGGLHDFWTHRQCEYTNTQVGRFREEVREWRCRWFGRVQRKDEEYISKRRVDVEYTCKKKRGRSKRRYIDGLKKDKLATGLREKNLLNRTNWGGET